MKSFKGGICIAGLMLAIVMGLCDCQNASAAVSEKSLNNSDPAVYTDLNISKTVEKGSESEENAVTVLCREEKNKKTVYSFDDGKTWIPENEAEKRLSTLDIEWWTYDDFAQYVESQKKAYKEYAAGKATGYINGEYFVWDDAYTEEAVKRLEDDLECIKNGGKISRIVSETDIDDTTVECACLASDGNENAAREFSYAVELADGTEHEITGKTKEDLNVKVKDYCNELLNAGSIDSSSYEEIIKDSKQ